jgi:hypothetical protein
MKRIIGERTKEEKKWEMGKKETEKRKRIGNRKVKEKIFKDYHYA